MRLRTTVFAILVAVPVPLHALEIETLKSICSDGGEDIVCAAYIRGAIDAVPQAAFIGWLEARSGVELSGDGSPTVLIGYCPKDGEPMSRVIDRVANNLDNFTSDYDAGGAIITSLSDLYPCD